MPLTQAHYVGAIEAALRSGRPPGKQISLDSFRLAEYLEWI